MRATLTREPWNDLYELRLWYPPTLGGPGAWAAIGAENGETTVKRLGELDQIPVFLKLRPEAVEALAKELLKVTQASDQTLEALADARTVRDRLLTMVEKIA